MKTEGSGLHELLPNSARGDIDGIFPWDSLADIPVRIGHLFHLSLCGSNNSHYQMMATKKW
jgi:hypothetical protein